GPLSTYLEDEALEVERLGDGPMHGMVRRLCAVVQFAHLTVRIARCIGHHGSEQLGRHVLAARAGHEYPAGWQALHGAEVDLLVSTRGPFDRTTALGEGRWIEHHHIPGTSCTARRDQVIEHV